MEDITSKLDWNMLAAIALIGVIVIVLFAIMMGTIRSVAKNVAKYGGTRYEKERVVTKKEKDSDES